MIETLEAAAPVLGATVIVMAASIGFAMTPLSNVLNIITVPLGYQWQSCPHCPDFGVEKITKAECENCGEEHVENWGAARYKDGERIPFCSNECMYDWKEGSGQ